MIKDEVTEARWSPKHVCIFMQAWRGRCVCSASLCDCFGPRRCQDATSRISIKFNVREGQSGELQVRVGTEARKKGRRTEDHGLRGRVRSCRRGRGGGRAGGGKRGGRIGPCRGSKWVGWEVEGKGDRGGSSSICRCMGAKLLPSTLTLLSLHHQAMNSTLLSPLSLPLTRFPLPPTCPSRHVCPCCTT